MKVSLITPWRNAWVPLYAKAFKERGHRFGVFPSEAPQDSDIVLHGWAIGTKPVLGAKNIVFLRRYELFDGGLSKIDWGRTDALICVNDWIKEVTERLLAENGVKTPVHLIYNAADLAKWTFKVRDHGKKIGMACHIHPKKNLPLAVQILGALPEGYELHIAGQIQDSCTAEYLNHIAHAVERKLFLYDHVEELNDWWDGMDYCLSTSLSEGNPNNVIEAMAKGIKPVVHCWPGAREQFDGHLFRTVQEAVSMIMADPYDSLEYRQLVEEKFSPKNIEKVVDLCVS